MRASVGTAESHVQHESKRLVAAIPPPAAEDDGGL
jgi:hypothetical protein